MENTLRIQSPKQHDYWNTEQGILNLYPDLDVHPDVSDTLNYFQLSIHISGWNHNTFMYLCSFDFALITPAVNRSRMCMTANMQIFVF